MVGMTRHIKFCAAGILMLFAALGATAQGDNPAGKWKGSITSDGVKVEAKLNIKSQQGGTFAATLDLNVGGQPAYGIPASECTYNAPTGELKVVFAAIGGLEVSGVQHGEELKGRIGGGGNYDSITLKRIEMPASVAAGTAYAIDSVTIKNGKVKLAATVTHPWEEGKYPALVLVSGSGPQDRDETIFNHKPFAAIADYLTQQGIVVVRYDDRGVGASTGDFASATTADFASDAAAAVKYARGLRYVNKEKVGVLGHSEGGVIAMMLAADGKKNAPDFIALMAAPGVPLKTILVRQNEESMSMLLPEERKGAFSALAASFFDDYIKSMGDRTADSARIAQFMDAAFAMVKPEMAEALKGQGVTKEALITQSVATMATPWFRYFLKIDPADYLSRINCSVLVLQGGRDKQVPADENITAIRNGLSKAKNNRLMVKRYEDLNHLFVPCRTGSLQEYPTISAPFSSQVLDDLAWWVSTR